jgi:hypothetical protein
MNTAVVKRIALITIIDTVFCVSTTVRSSTLADSKAHQYGHFRHKILAILKIHFDVGWPIMLRAT